MLGFGSVGSFPDLGLGSPLLDVGFGSSLYGFMPGLFLYILAMLFLTLVGGSRPKYMA
jgi:hypothetical protein